MLDLYLLKYFLAVVETGSFTGAARRVFVTQPTLSAGIKKLEGQVGHTLFERSNKRVFLTDAGTRFLPRAKAILHECNMAVQALETEGTVPVLRLGVLSTLADWMVQDVLGSFHAAYPDYVIEVTDGTEQELINRMDDRTLDFAISLNRGDESVRAVTLLKEGYRFILSKDHALSSQASVSARDLREEYMVVRKRCEVLSETSRYFTDQNVRPRLVYRTNNDARAIAIVAAGLGGGLVPESMAKGADVSSFALKGFDYKREIALLCPLYSLPEPLQQAAGVFEKHIVAHLSAKDV